MHTYNRLSYTSCAPRSASEFAAAHEKRSTLNTKKSTSLRHQQVVEFRKQNHHPFVYTICTSDCAEYNPFFNWRIGPYPPEARELPPFRLPYTAVVATATGHSWLIWFPGVGVVGSENN